MGLIQLRIQVQRSLELSFRFRILALSVRTTPLEACTCDQSQKRFKNLRRQKQGLALAQQNLLVNIKGELSKPIKMFDEPRHDFPSNFL
jgi:hypothetical protein